MSRRASTFGESVRALPLRRPWLVVALALVATAWAAWALPFVRVQPDVSRLLPQDHPDVEVAALLADRARPARSLWLLVGGEAPAAALPALAEALRSSALVARVATTREEVFGEAVARAQRAPLWQLDDEGLSRLSATLSADGRRAAIESLLADLADDPIAGREIAVRDPLGLRWVGQERGALQAMGLDPESPFLVTADGARALLQLEGMRDAYDADFATAVCEHVERVLGDRPFEVFGGYAVARADQARLRADFERASTLAVLLIGCYLCLAMRGLRLPLAVQAPAMLSILWAIPLGGVLFGPLPTVAVAAVAVLCGLGVDFSIHYAARYRRARLTMAHAEAVVDVQRTTTPELLIDMATTAVTFLAIGFGTEGGLASFGLLLATGLVLSVLLTIFLLPVLLRWVGERRDPERSLFARLADRWLARPAARPVAVTIAGFALVVGVLVAVRGLPLTAEAASLRPADDPVAAARERIEAALGCSTTPAVVLWPAERDASPLLAALEGLRRDGELRFWSGLGAADTVAGRARVEQFRREHRGFADAFRRELAAAGLEPEPFAPALADLEAAFARDPEPAPPVEVAVGERRSRAVTVWPAGRLDALRHAELVGLLTERAGPDARLHGTATVTAALATVLQRDLERALVLAFVLALLMVTLWLRSLRVGLCALLPSVVGLSLTLGVILLLGVELTLVSFVAVPFVLGIGVDEGVHLVGHFRHGAVDTGETGVSVARTSIGTILGFSALLFAESPSLVALGAIVGGGSFLCMAACLFVLAPLLARRASAAAAG